MTEKLECSTVAQAGQVATPQLSLEMLFGLTRRAIRAADLKELGFLIANETWQLLHYRQAIVYFRDRIGKLELTTISGLVNCTETTPYTEWLGRLSRALDAALPAEKVAPLSVSMLDDSLREGWLEWWPSAALYVPLRDRDGECIGCVLLLRDDPFLEPEQAALSALSETWSHCVASFQAKRLDLKAWRARANGWANRKRKLLAAIGVVLLFPVRLSAIAPAEIIPLQAEAIAAPMDGVVNSFSVTPNAQVKAGDTLFLLDETTLRNRKAVAEKSLAIARADAMATQQKAFDNTQSRGELASLIARVREREAELAFVNDSFARIEFKAPQDGIFVYTDPNDWIGKPVVTGERIGQIAQSNDLGVLVWLPAGDAINLELGADMRMFTQTSPLSALNATLIQTSYQATRSPEGIVSYRIRGRLVDTGDARIGQRGTAKVYGAWRPLVYWMLRRPLGALRQFLGV